MKKTVKINISSVIFHLDEDAYQILQNYLTAINQRFASTEEGKEIITDIEHRIAEILQSKLSEQKQVISSEDVNEVIEIMGRPEDFEGEEENTNTHNQYYDKSSKRLYRDSENRILGGVNSGIANYLNIDPLIIRILFFAMMFAYGIIGIIYIVLWALLPAATTTAQKLDMRGEKLNISDIEKNVRKEYDTVKDNLKNFKNSKDYERTQGFFENLTYAIGAFFRFIFKFIGAVIGLALIVAGVGFLIGLTGTLIIGEPFMPWNNLIINDHVVFSDMLHSFVDPNTLWIIAICAVMVVFIPLFGIIYGGFKLLFGIRPKDRPVAGIGFAAWLLSLIVLIVLVGLQVRDFSYSVSDPEKIVVEQTENKTIYLKAREDREISTSTFYIFDEEFEIMYGEDDNKQLYAFPEIDIVQGYSDQVVIEIEKEGRGSNRKQALENAEDIEYRVMVKDTVVIFDAVYSILDKHNWRFPEVDITIKVPEGYILYLDDSVEEQLDYIQKEKYYRHDEMVGKYWIMTNEGLEKYYKVTYDDE